MAFNMIAPPPGFKISPYDQVMNAVLIRLPHLDRNQVDNALISIRQFCGDLRGFNVSTLTEAVCERFSNVNMNQPVIQSDPNYVDLPPGQTYASFPVEETFCTICTSQIDFNIQEIDMLDCGHNFHIGCIRPWLEMNKTCPNCRTYSLLATEYPALQ